MITTQFSTNIVLLLSVLLLLLVSLCFSQVQQDTLTLGEAIFKDLAKNQPQYFTIPLLATPLHNDTRLLLSLTSISGDADMYLSVSNPTPGPTTGGYDFSSSTNGEDLIVLTSNSTGAFLTGPYYVGIVASVNNAYYSILAFKTNEHITMKDGLPQIAHVEWKQSTFFKFQATGKPFTISSTAIYGDPDIYVSDLTPFPSKTNYTMKKTGVGTDLLSVVPVGATPRMYYIAIYGFSVSSFFNLEITENNSSALLAANIPLVDNISSRSVKFFKFKLTYATDLNIKVQKRSFSGDPSVYVSTIHERPSFTFSEWKGITAYRAEDVFIGKDDVTYTSNGYYYIAVYDDSMFNVDVSISVELVGTSTIISSGNPVSGVAPKGKFIYFKAFYQTRAGDHAQYVEITATPSNVGGQVQLYAGGTEFPDVNSEFKGITVMSSNIVHISSPKQGWLYIALLAVADSSYTITVSQAKQFINLDPGVTVSYNVQSAQYRDFVFQADPNNDHDIIFSMHSYSGDADFYIGTNSNVSRQSSIWSSSLGSSDVLTISKNDPNRHTDAFSGQFFIAVYGFRDAYFSITAFFGNSTLELFDGVTVTSTVDRLEYAYFKYFLTNPASLSIHVRAVNTQSDPDLYASMENVYPTKENKQWESWHLGDDFISIPYATRGWYYIGVYGFRQNTSFSLSASSGAESLSSYGYSLVDYVTKGQYRYYNSYIYPDDTNPVITGVTLIAGHTELYGNNNQTLPSTTDYLYKDASWPGNFITVAPSNATRGRWSFAVYGVENSYYYIHASSKDIQGALRKGEPKIGVVKKGESAGFKYAYFYGETGSYAVYLNQIASIPSRIGIYVDQYPNQHPNATSNRWSAEGNDDLLLLLSNATKDASFFITVTSYDADIRFQISFDKEDEPIYLTEEQPNKVATKTGNSHFFEVPAIPLLPGQNSSQLLVVVASCQDIEPPMLYGSIHTHRPNKDDKDFSSASDGKYRQKMLSPVNQVTNTLYYVGTAPSAADYTFSIYGTTSGDSRPTLTASMEVGDLISTTEQRIKIPRAVGHGPIRYFFYKRVLTAQEDSASINMQTVCAIQNGKAQMVTEIPTDSSDAFNLFYDMQVDSQQRYIINVVAVDMYGLSSAFNAIAFNTGDTNTLTLGKSLRSNVTKESYARFKLISVTIPDNGFLSIVLTPFSGDVDLYVDIQQDFNKGNAKWKGEQGGFDIITIQRSEVAGATVNFYVAIYGSTEDSMFSVIAYTNDAPQLLQDGWPQVGDVAEFAYKYYKFFLDDNSTFTITLTPIDGDPDLIASRNTDRPTRDSAQWYSSGGAIDMIVISNTDVEFREGAEYFIGIYGWTAAKFELTVTKQNSIAQVTEGVPHGGQAVRGAYDYFKFTLTSPRSVFITVTSLLDGSDPDIFVSTISERPGVSDHQWKRDKSGGVDTLYIPKDSDNWKLGTYYISVRAWGKDSVFQVVARSEDSSYLLADGASQRFNPIIGGYATFKFFYGFSKNILTFSLTTDIEGAIEFYGSKSITKPTREKHDYVGQAQGAYQYITIEQGSSVQWYFVSVYGLSNCTYTISASTNQRPNVLTDGVLDQFNYVESDSYVYFTLDFDQSLHRDITISTLTEFGDPDLYVSTNVTRPTKELHTWKKRNAGSDTLIIPSLEIPVIATRLYIGAYGFSASRFAIVALSSNQTVELLDATPIVGFVKVNEYKQYKYDMTNTGRLKFTLNVLSGFPADADIYVSRNPNPSEGNCEYKGDDFGSDIIEFDATAVWYYLSVRGPKYGPASGGVSYSLQANTLYETIEVGGFLRDNGRDNKPRLYKVAVSSLADHVLTSVTMINGRTELYINTNETVPTREHHDFSSKDFPGNVINIHNDMNDATFRPGTWSLAVYSLQESDYFVSVQTREGVLYAGIPRAGFVDPAAKTGVVTYVYRVGWGEPRITINARPFGDVNSCLLIYGSQTITNPTESEHTWKAQSKAAFGNQVIMVLSNNLNEGKNLYLTVQSCSSHSVKYEISLNSDHGTAYLTQNYDSLFTPTNSEYIILTPRRSSILYIKVDSCDGVPMESVQLTASKTKNNTINPEYIGSVGTDNPFTSLIDARAIDHEKSGLLYVQLRNLRIPPLFMSIFTTTSTTDPRPKSGLITAKSAGTVTIEKVKKIQFDLNFDQIAEGQIANVYLIEADQKYWDKKHPDAILTKYNMFTACGIRMNQNVALVGKTTGKETSVRIAVDLDRVYIINVIVLDPVTHLERAYAPLAISKGQVVVRALKFSVGSLLILLAMTLIVCYLIAGVSYNLIKGQETGINVLPQYRVWSEIPSIILEGVKFVVFCGRTGSNYSVFEDEGFNAETDPNPFSISNTEKPQSTGATGYGSI